MSLTIDRDRKIERLARIIFPQRIPKTIAVAEIQPMPNKNMGNALSIPIYRLDNKKLQLRKVNDTCRYVQQTCD